jgi:hypothetical protein
MNRYFTLPDGKLEVVDPLTDKVSGEVGHDEIAKVMMMDPHVKDSMDACDRYDLRKKLLQAPGSLVELTEDEHKVLVQVAKKPTTLLENAVYSPSVYDFLRRILNASTDKPG